MFWKFENKWFKSKFARITNEITFILVLVHFKLVKMTQKKKNEKREHRELIKQEINEHSW